MIDEIFLKSAVNIRKNYITTIRSVESYQKKASEIIGQLENHIKDLEDIKKRYSIERKSTDKEAIDKILEVIRGVELEGEKLEKMLEPMNKEIEKLSKEENELYRNIKEKHPKLSDSQIVESVQNRLKREGLI